jgi:transcriptional regulator with XRE-family HTH domain
MTLAERLKEIIERKDLTPYEISSVTGIKESTLSRILRGKTKKPQPETLKLLANYLQTSVVFLKTGNEEQKSIESNIKSDSSEMKDVFKILIAENKDLHEQNATLREQLAKLTTELQSLGGESISHKPVKEKKQREAG